MMRLLVTGGSGFIGSNFVRYMLKEHPDLDLVNLDKLTYAGNPASLKDLEDDPRYTFVYGDICDPVAVEKAMVEHACDTVVHFAAESHVDRSIHDASAFVRTNLLGTATMLEAARRNDITRFIHISTDEVYGSTLEGAFVETDRLEPSSPYSSSKAGSDLLAKAYATTYGLNVSITRCSNNYGPYQFPEKVIPLFVTNLMDGARVPLYGEGANVRDWLHVEDHCRGIALVLAGGRAGEVYNIGGGTELTNAELTYKLIEATGRERLDCVLHRGRIGDVEVGRSESLRVDVHGCCRP